MANRIISLPETKGNFKLKGVVSGTKRDKFYTEKITKSDKDMRIVNFTVKTNETSDVQVSLNGMERDEVFFYKRAEKKGEKGEVKRIAFSERNNFNEKDFRLIGVNVGLSRKIDEKGKEVNDSKMLAEYDAVKEIKDNIEDDLSVFVKGNIEFSNFKKDDDTIARSTKFIPSQVSLCGEVEFKEENYEEVNDFKQTIIFTGVEMDDSNLDDKKGVVTAKIVTYSTIEEAEFIIRNKKLYDNFKKKLKPYTSITVWGKINNRVEVEEVSDNDTWGDEDSFEKPSREYIRELVITGADANSIDTETYSEKQVEEAIRAIKEFGDEKSDTSESETDGEWGEMNKEVNDEDEAW